MKPPYINRVIQQGVVTTKPSVKSISSRTKVTAFQLSTVESWTTGTGETKERKNRIQVEIVGRDAEEAFEKIRLGSWVFIDGYIRSEVYKGQNLTKMRVFSYEVWEE
jgi:single stranded DNA-binding protein